MESKHFIFGKEKGPTLFIASQAVRSWALGAPPGGMDRLRGQQGWAGSPGRAGWPQAPGQGRLGQDRHGGGVSPLLLLTASPGSPHCLFQVATPRPPPPPITAGGPWGPALGVRGQHLLKGTLRSLCSWGPWSPPWAAPWSQAQLPLPLGAPHPPRLTIYPPTTPEPPRAKRRTRATEGHQARPSSHPSLVVGDVASLCSVSEVQARTCVLYRGVGAPVCGADVSPALSACWRLLSFPELLSIL